MTLTNVCNTSPNPPPIYHVLFLTPGADARHASLSKTPYSKPRTNHRSSTPPHHPTLFPIFLRHHNTLRSKSPHQFFLLFHPAVTPQPYDKLSAHLHCLHAQKLGCTLLFVLLLRLDLDCHRNLCITRNTAYYRMVTPSQGSHITMFGAQ